MAEILTVSSLNLYVKSILDSDDNLYDVAVEGELSNFKKYPSGHCYFTLKDEKSAIKGVMFSSYVRNLSFIPENGMKVIIRGKVSLYERDGAYQIYATNMFRSGDGAYRIEFERIKNKLGAEGLFDREKKKSLPKYPFKIGVATSEKGAAFHDIVSVAQRRFPCAEIVLAPCMVQGAEAEPTIINAIKQLDSLPDIQVIIIGRGGGSKEDLWVFNSEKVARTAYACKKPTISAVGHEVDFSILDFVCDVRASTPTAAAELCFPDINAVNMRLLNMNRTMSSRIKNEIKILANNLLSIEKSDGFLYVHGLAEKNKNHLAEIKRNLDVSINNKINLLKKEVRLKAYILESGSPLNNLKRGYALIYDEEGAVKHCDFTVGETAKILTFTQELECEVVGIKQREN